MSRQRRFHLTVQDIRSNAESRNRVTETRSEGQDFNIFDGSPDPESPWAKYVDNDDEELPGNVEGNGSRKEEMQTDTG